MATPMTAAQFARALRAEGLNVHERSGWSTHNRGQRGTGWGPLNGVMIHHTASGDGKGIVDLCYSGRADLPGPLCHGVIHKNGEVTLVGWGRANHAGTGDADALDAVINESAHHPKPGRGTVDGNSRFVGFECVNRGDGKDPWPEAQLVAIARAAAAVCRHYGWGEHSVIGHLEWTNQKIDPAGFSMNSMRDRIAAVLAAPAGRIPEEDDMQLNDQVGIGDWMPRRWPDDKGLADKKISVGTALGSAYGHARVAHEGVDVLRKEVAELRDQVTQILTLLTETGDPS
ncbi:N-acetylmuramoyl-L-alanine amidase [Streptomyces sp. NPDC058045]|uniref:N-acetylmuramoyl-L-alanine amidase n=1 Tax=Streptomyces sp. NPDC058045 TaxID=3346311 RepID=UPI0036EA4DFF